MKLRLAIIAALGLALIGYLLSVIGLRQVLTAAASVGWGGFAILCLYGLALFAVLGLAWWTIMPAAGRAALRVFIWARMVRDGGAEVLPLSQVGGMALGARAAVLHGVAPPLAIASMIVDVTTEMLAQLAYVSIGILILSTRMPESALTRSLTTLFSVGLLVAAAGGGIFLVLQRYGHHWIATRLASRIFPRSMAVTTGVATALDAIYAAPWRFALSISIHLSGWLASAVGTWIAFRLIGQPVELLSVIAIESLVYATRTAGAIVPNALGVQEAAYALLTPLLGIGKEYGLAVSLLKRARDITLGVPTLLAWQAFEGRRALALKDAGNS